MKRPFAVTGIAAAAVCLLAKGSLYLTVGAVVASAVIFCILLLFPYFRRNKIAPVALGAAVLVGISLIAAQLNLMNTAELKDRTAHIEAVVCADTARSDYASTYILRVSRVNGERKSFKIRYASMNDMGLRQGDGVAGTLVLGAPEQSGALWESSLASGIYFTAFAGEADTLEKNGERNIVLYLSGLARECFKNAVSRYLPGEAGAVINAMVIGDRSELSEQTSDIFNYSGTSHLLVVSGLHLSLWSLGVISFMGKFSRLRRLTVPAGFICLFGYAALTGFGVSVLRAGAMVSGVLLGKLFHRGADSLNSIGLAMTLILLVNPFSVYSAALWLSVLSTTGILTLSDKTETFICGLSFVKPVAGSRPVKSFIKALSVSLPVTVFTAPVFIAKFQMLSVAAFLSNFLMVSAALVLMVTAAAGFVLHIIGLAPIAEGVFFFCGLLVKYLRFCAEKIGMSELSSISVTHRYYKLWLIAALLLLLTAVILRRFGKKLMKPAAVLAAGAFLLVSLYCAGYEKSTVTVEAFSVKNRISVLINSGDSEILLGSNFNGVNYSLGDALNGKNKKRLDIIYSLDTGGYSVPGTAEVRERFGGEMIFYGSAPRLFGFSPRENIKQLSADGRVSLRALDSSAVEIIGANKKILIIFSAKNENSFENINKYDIIIVNENDFEKLRPICTAFNNSLIKLGDAQSLSVRL